MKKIESLMLLLAMTIVSGCATTGAPVAGSLYTDVHYAGLSYKGVGLKKLGEACATSYLGMVATGDASIKAAARGKEVLHVDHSGFSILGVYGKHCTIAYGAGGPVTPTPASAPAATTTE